MQRSFDPTTAIAVYGALLATISFGLSLWLGILKYKEKMPNLRVTHSVGRLIDGFGKSSEQMIFFEGLNVGSGQISITGVGWILKDGTKLQYMRPYQLKIPSEIPERKKATFYFPCRWLKKEERAGDIRWAFYNDEMGKTWKRRIPKRKISKWLNIESDGWELEWDESLSTYVRDSPIGGPRIPIPG